MTTHLTTTSYLVLGLVARLETATPYDLKRAVFHTIEYFWAFPHSQLYAEPERLKKAGYLQESRERGGRRRRSFSITEKGREALAVWLREPTEELVEIRDLGLLKLYFGDLGSPQAVLAMAHQQAELHRKRLSEYETLFAARQNKEALAYPLAVLEMGLLFERAAIAFWTAVAAELPGVSKRLPSKLNFEELPPQVIPKTQKTRSQKTQARLPAQDASNDVSTGEAHSAHHSVEPVLKEEIEAFEGQEPVQEDLPDHLL
jgi:PadR family transcriptional regulator, regulatory protein AphA